MGGSDEPSNLIRVNIPMHAFLHYRLWQERGKLEDNLAGYPQMSELVEWSQLSYGARSALRYYRWKP
jgi:hypothetical protein